ncbi:M16 family metallopeptidase [Candidatus Margulisiibacteriota bacterium]
MFETKQSNIIDTSFSNGLTLRLIETENSLLTGVSLAVPAGSLYEHQNNNGIAHLIEHLIFCEKQPKDQSTSLPEILENNLGNIGASTHREYTCYCGNIIYDKVEMFLSALLEIISLKSPYNLSQAKAVVLAEIEEFKRNVLYRLVQKAHENIFRSHPLSLEVCGKRENVNSLTPIDIEEYYNKHYQASNCVLSIAGKFEPAKILNFVGNFEPIMAMSGQVGNSPPPFKIRPANRETIYYHVPSSLLILGLIFAHQVKNKKEEILIELIEAMLGKGKGCLLYKLIRNKLSGYSYISRLVSYKEVSLLTLGTVCNAPGFVKTLAELCEVLVAIKSGRMKEEVLERAKQYLKCQKLQQWENNLALSAYYSINELLGRQDSSLTEYFELIKSITVKDVKCFAQKLFNYDNVRLIICGNIFSRCLSAKGQKILSNSI